jgi:hypothetical protein
MTVRSPRRHAAALLRRLSLLSAFAAALLLAGCGSSESAFTDEEAISYRFLPQTQRVGHPDSMRYVQLRDSGDRAFTADTSLRALQTLWSAGAQCFTTRCAFRPEPFQTYATLRSKDYVVLRLNREWALTSISADSARSKIREALNADYQPYVAFDLYLFGRNETLTRLRDLRPYTITLKDGQGNRYEPTRVQNPPPTAGVAFRDQQYARYNVNTVYFDRVVDGRDILEEADRLQLTVRTQYGQMEFDWRIDPSSARTARASRR